MSLVDELLADGTVTQDPDFEDRVVFPVNLYIKKKAVDAGGFQMFASEFGYEKTIATEDAEGNPLPPIENPVSIYEFCKDQARKYVTDVFRSAVIKKANIDAKAQADALLDHVLK